VGGVVLYVNLIFVCICKFDICIHTSANGFSIVLIRLAMRVCNPQAY